MEHGRAARGRRSARLLATVVATLMLTVACGASGAGSSGSASNHAGGSGTLRVGISAPLNSLKPVGLQQTDMTYNRAIYNTLVDVGSGSALVPDLATSWAVSGNGLTLTMHLRTGVNFQNGAPFNSQAVVAMLKWAQNPANALDATTVLTGMSFAAPDASTVVITMPSAESQELLPTFVTLPIADLSSNLTTDPVGTGPFKVTSFTPNVSLTLSRWSGYWNHSALPKISEIKYTVFEDQASEVAALQANAIDILTYPPLNQVKHLKSLGYHVASSPGTGNFYFFGNVETTGPLANEKVREALSYAWNRPLFAKLELGDLGVPTCDMWAKTSPAFVQNIPGCGYDLKKAKQLLTEAGYGSGLTLNFITTGVRIPEMTSFLPVYKTALAQIGVTLNIENVSANTWANNFTLIRDKQLGGVQDNFYGWANDDAYFAADYAVYGLDDNLSNYSSPEYDGLIKQALAQTNPAKATAIYKQLAILAAQEAFSIVVATRPYVDIVDKSVSGDVVDDDGQNYWNNVTVS